MSLKHQLLQVIVRVAQYRMLLTGESHVKAAVLLHICIFHAYHLHCFSLLPLIDYLNNLSPDSKEYEDTQGTINKQEHPCGQRLLALLVTGEPYCPVFVALCL